MNTDYMSRFSQPRCASDMAVAGAGEDPLEELVEVIRSRRGAATVVKPPFVDRSPR